MKPAILLVDDKLSLLVPTARLLRELGYAVITARNGDEALEILQNGDVVNVVVTDVQMPGQHGFELARCVKDLRPDIVIVYCTEQPEMVRDNMCPPLGPFVTKPYTAERLHQEIERVLCFGHRDGISAPSSRRGNRKAHDRDCCSV